MGLFKRARQITRVLRRFPIPPAAENTPGRVCRFEQMEPRLMLAADPLPEIQVGAVYTEQTSAGATELDGDRFEITWSGGAAGTQLTHLVISGDQDLVPNGFDEGDVFFDPDANPPGSDSSFPFTFLAAESAGIDSVSASVSADGLTLTLDIVGWDPGETLAFTIDVDEQDESGANSLVEGAEFERSILTADFVDTAGHYQDASGSATFFDVYDNAIIDGLGLPLDGDLPPGEGTHVRTAGASTLLNQTPRPVTIAGQVYHDVNLDGVMQAGEAGVDGVEVELFILEEGRYVSTGQTAVTSGGGFYSFEHECPGTFRVVETQPGGYYSTGASSTLGAATSDDVISGITLQGGERSGDNKFGEALPVTLSGHVYHDVDDDGARDPGETGIGNVTIEVYKANPDGSLPLSPTASTSTANDGSGFWEISGLAPGTYTVVEIQPGVDPVSGDAWVDGKDAVGTLSGVAGPVGELLAPDSIRLVAFTASGQVGVDYDFGELLPGGLSGHVFMDFNDNIVLDPGDGDAPLAGVTLYLLDAQGNRIASTVTDADGYYEFHGLIPRLSYGVEEIQPTGLPVVYDGHEKPGDAGGAVTSNDKITGIVVGSAQQATGYDFGELPPASLTTQVYVDVNYNGTMEMDEPGIAGVLVELLDESGQPTGVTGVTGPDGRYTFTDLEPGVYGVREVEQPGGYYDGQDIAGSAGGTAFNDFITGAALAPGMDAVDYKFGELLPASLTTQVYVDVDGSGTMEAGEPGIEGVLVELLDANGQGTGVFGRTGADGKHTFNGLAPGVYGVREAEQPTGYFDGQDIAGSAGGTAFNDFITGAVLTPGLDAVDYKFGELLPASLTTQVYVDVDGSGTMESNEPGIEGVLVELLDANGQGTGVFGRTGADGKYTFSGLAPGVYGVREVEQPEGYYDGQDIAGSAGGTAFNDFITGAVLGPGMDAVDYKFGELLPASLTTQVYVDVDGSGTMEAGEPGIEGVLVELLDASGQGTGVFGHTDADGKYTFSGLAPGVYGVREVEQPDGYYDGQDIAGSAGGMAFNDFITGAVLGPGMDAVDYKFGELLPASLTTQVYVDLDGSGTMESNEPGIEGVLVELLDANGEGTGVFGRTGADGKYTFSKLEPGVYGVREVEQPAPYSDGQDSAGSAGGTAFNDYITGATLAPGMDAVDYKFGELPPSTLTTQVYIDLNNNGTMEASEPGIQGVLVELLDANGRPTGITGLTGPDGTYTFTDLQPGVYGVREVQQPAGLFDGQDIAGNAGGTAFDDYITGAELPPAFDATGYKFGELLPATISGYVFLDGPVILLGSGQTIADIDIGSLRDGVRSPGDAGIGGVTLHLADAEGNLLTDGGGSPIAAVTDANGFYYFGGLEEGTYTVIQVHPSAYIDGVDRAGTTGGVAENPGDAISRIRVTYGQHSRENNFSEVLVDELPLFVPPPELPPAVIPEPQIIPVPVVVATPPLPPSPPDPGQTLLFGGGAVSTAGYSWHLSIIDAGNPRGEAGQDALVQVSQVKMDAIEREAMNEGRWTLVDGEKAARREVVFGSPDGVPVTGDFDGDGVTEVAVFVDGDWYLDLNGNGVWDEGDLWARLGKAGDVPVAGDWDGDGKTDIGIFGPEWPNDARAVMSEPGLPDRENDTSGAKKNLPPRPHEATLGKRLMRRTSTGKTRTDVIDHVFYYGGPSDVPVVGDWNGDGVQTIGVFQGGVWVLDVNGDGRWLPGETMIELGAAGDLPVVGDWNGDGIDDLGVYRNGRWHIDSNGDGVLDARDRAFQLGGAGDQPVVGDWDGDGTDDPGVYQPGRGGERTAL